MSHALYALKDFESMVVEAETKPYIMRLRDLPVDEKPREKLMKYGSDVLSVAELLAVVLGVGTKKEEVYAMTHRILREYGEQALSHQTNVAHIMDELSIPETKACQIIACFALGRRFYANGVGRSVIIRTPEQAYQHVKDMGALEKEHLKGLYLNNHYRLIHEEVISIGSVDAHIIHPREVFRPALEYAASAVILAHNHPSGSAQPSEADIAVTEQLSAAGEMLGIELLDHIVVTKTGFQRVVFKS